MARCNNMKNKQQCFIWDKEKIMYFETEIRGGIKWSPKMA